ncbi:hypothetical protein N7G274_005349 [Stereocaulon virgatum]|uniref:Uncharacterized protein n=1 Tax=Stereocaulon virgatum TaxID=373712 RepID=A0ABR4A9S1_9LECA
MLIIGAGTDKYLMASIDSLYSAENTAYSGVVNTYNLAHNLSLSFVIHRKILLDQASMGVTDWKYERFFERKAKAGFVTATWSPYIRWFDGRVQWRDNVAYRGIPTSKVLKHVDDDCACIVSVQGLWAAIKIQKHDRNSLAARLILSSFYVSLAIQLI